MGQSNEGMSRALQPLQWSSAVLFFVIESAPNGLVKPARGEIGRHASINHVRVVPIEPRIKFQQLLRRQRVDRIFDFSDCIEIDGEDVLGGS